MALHEKMWVRALILALAIFIIAIAANDKGTEPSGSQKSSQTPVTKKVPVPGEAEFNAGVDAMIAQDHKTALVAFKESVDKGNSEAKAFMGFIYLSGATGVKRDTKKGFALVQEAANHGSGFALSELGTYYIYGKYGLKKDAQTGLNLIKKAMDAGHYRGYSTMASLYETGAGVGKDFDKAVEMYQKAAQSGGPSHARDIKRIKDRPNYEMTVAYITKEYEANEVAADIKYKGKTIRITGRVETVGKDIKDNLYVTLKHPDPWSIRNAQFFFDKNQTDELASLSKGQQVTIQGTVGGLMLNVIVNKSWIVDK